MATNPAVVRATITAIQSLIGRKEYGAAAKELGQLKDVKIYGNSMIKAAAKIDIDGDKNE